MMGHKDIPILYYKNVVRSTNNPEFVLMSDFVKQIDFLISKGYEFVSLGQLKDYLESSGSESFLPKDCAVIAFEAREGLGNVSSFLEEKGIKAAIYVAAGNVGKEGFLDWSELKEILENKNLELGSLGLSCADFLNLDEEGINSEIEGSAKIIEDNLGIRPKHFSFLMSRYDSFSKMAYLKQKIEEAGYSTALSGRELLNNKFLDAFELSRITVLRSTFLGKFKQVLQSPTLSFCMIAKNEEKFIGKCLASIRDIADEIVVIDTGSTDGTKEIAESFGAKIVDAEWTGDFSRARNTYLKHATGDWILVLDADEIVERQDLPAIKKLITMDFDAFTLVLRNYTNNVHDLSFVKSDKEAYGAYGIAGYIPMPLVRLFKNNEKYHYTGEVHEILDESLISAKARIGDSDLAIHHLEALKGDEQIAKKQRAYLEYSLKTLESNQNDFKTLCDIGLSYIKFLNNPAQAIEYLDRAKEIEPENPRVYFLLGEAHLHLKDYASAVESYAKVTSGDYAKDAFYNLAQIFLSFGYKKEAVEFYEKALKLGSLHREEILEKLKSLE